MSLNATEIRTEVTNRIVAALEAGTVPWQKPWVGDTGRPRNFQSGKPYRGLNALLLSLSDYSDPRWTTFAAARKMGAQVRKGEKSTLVTLWKRIKIKDDAAPNGYKIIPILRYFRVFNVEQVDWAAGTLPALNTAQPEGFDPIQEGEDALLAYVDSDHELSLHWGGNMACYTPARHQMRLPDRENFPKAAGFYGTAFHECGHSTARALKRELGGSFGSSPYATEELVAEMTATFVCAELGIEPDYPQNAAYIKNWLKRIKDDEGIVMKAAGQAQKAADAILLRSYQEPETTVDPTELDKTASVA